MQKLNSRSRSTVFAAEKLVNYTMSNMLINVISLANAKYFFVFKTIPLMARDVCGSAATPRLQFIKGVL